VRQQNQIVMIKQRRIDFSLYESEKKEKVSGGLLHASLKQTMSKDETLKSVITLIEPLANIFWVSNGDWSMHELLLELLNITGPATVHISSYAMGETPARILAQLKNTGMIRDLHCVLDSRIDVRTAGSFQLIKSISDEIVLVDTHAKVTVIKNDLWSIGVIGSANYTENKRYESGIISTHHEVANMQLKWINKAIKDGMA
jgi:hypothetical protein